MTQETCWTLIHAAALGRPVEREEFTRRYLTTVRAYLTARWQGTWLEGEIDDVVQEVFMACFRKGGALERVDTDRPGGFSAFLYGIVREQTVQNLRHPPLDFFWEPSGFGAYSCIYNVAEATPAALPTPPDHQPPWPRRTHSITSPSNASSPG